MRQTRFFGLCFSCLIASAMLTDAQLRRSPPPQMRPNVGPQTRPATSSQPRPAAAPQMRSTPAPPQPMRKPAELISRQEPMKVNQGVLKQCTPENTRIVVSIPKQRAYLMLGDQIAADAPVSSGKRGHTTPSGHFTVMEKDPNHHSSLYGDFVDGRGRVVRAGVSARVDSAPSGTRFAGAPMKWFLRLTGEGVGMHVGILPGYPASHGCIRESVDGAKLFYDHAKVGTPVDVGDF